MICCFDCLKCFLFHFCLVWPTCKDGGTSRTEKEGPPARQERACIQCTGNCLSFRCECQAIQSEAATTTTTTTPSPAATARTAIRTTASASSTRLLFPRYLITPLENNVSLESIPNTGFDKMSASLEITTLQLMAPSIRTQVRLKPSIRTPQMLRVCSLVHTGGVDVGRRSAGVGPGAQDRRTYAEELQEQMRLNEEKKAQEKKVCVSCSCCTY
jgi:hypothetical protein